MYTEPDYSRPIVVIIDLIKVVGVIILLNVVIGLVETYG